jgi:hypothetical protein
MKMKMMIIFGSIKFFIIDIVVQKPIRPITKTAQETCEKCANRKQLEENT